MNAGAWKRDGEKRRRRPALRGWKKFAGLGKAVNQSREEFSAWHLASAEAFHVRRELLDIHPRRAACFQVLDHVQNRELGGVVAPVKHALTTKDAAGVH